jgi:predicted transcriptional regulator
MNSAVRRRIVDELYMIAWRNNSTIDQKLNVSSEKMKIQVRKLSEVRCMRSDWLN